jgi:small-conductance mechanosensitive channel
MDRSFTLVYPYTRNGKRRMELSVGIACQDSVDAAFRMMRDIKAKIEEAGLHIPFPQRNVHVIESNPEDKAMNTTA